jgi:hypothetical protein
LRTLEERERYFTLSGSASAARVADGSDPHLGPCSALRTVVAGDDAGEVAACACTATPVASITFAIANANPSTLTNGADLDEALHRMPALFNRQRF